MNLEILTPDKSIFSGDISSLTVPGTQGSFEILTNHAPLISTLEKGKVLVMAANGAHKFTIKSGVVEVLNNKITLLAEGVIEKE